MPDVSHQTRIPVHHLQDLENDDYTPFASPIYARSFLQSYAGVLGVDPHSVTDEMAPAPAIGTQPFLGESEGRWIALEPDRTLTPAARRVRHSRVSDAVVAVVGILLLVGGVLWAAAIWSDHKNPGEVRRYPEPTATSARHATEEVRPAAPRQAERPRASASDMPIRKALPVDESAEKKNRR